MKILFDIISLQDLHNGGEEYTRCVFNVLNRLPDVEIFGLYDSKKMFLDNDEKELGNRCKLIDIQKFRIAKIIDEYNIDLFYIGIGQRYCFYDLDNINCKCVVTIHDIGDIEIWSNDINKLLFSEREHEILNKASQIYHILKNEYTRRSVVNKYKNLLRLLMQPNTTIITVSDYSKNSIQYYFKSLRDKDISVLYPPQKEYVVTQNPQDELLSAIISAKTKYILFVNGFRIDKNFKILKRISVAVKDKWPELKFLVTGFASEISQKCDNIITIGHLSNSDIELAYKYAWALLYPSFVEGFGYPPVESIKYGVPVLSSNVCSMPEILLDSAVYFSPFYQSDLLHKINLLNKNYSYYCKKAKNRSHYISNRQMDDFKSLITILTQ